MKESIAKAKHEIADSKTEETEASKDVERIEKDMKEFSNNKDSKLAELQTAVEKLRKALNNSSSAVKPLQQEMRDSKVEAEQCDGDLTAAQEGLDEAQTTITSQEREIATLKAEQERVKVGSLRIWLKCDERADLYGIASS